MTAEQQLERSVLESKERDELHAIAQALSVRTTTRTKKADMIDSILKATVVSVELSGAGDEAGSAIGADRAVSGAAPAEGSVQDRGAPGGRPVARRARQAPAVFSFSPDDDSAADDDSAPDDRSDGGGRPGLPVTAGVGDHADPAGDLPAAALALDARMVIEGPGGRRTVEAADFFVDYLQTALAPDEVLVEVRVPKLEGQWGVHYEKFNRVAQAWAIVGVAAAVRRDNGSIAEARVGLTNMGSTPLRAHRVEAALAGADARPEAVADAATFASEGTTPPSDLGGKADYRTHLAEVLTRRAVLHAAGIG